MEGTHEHLNWFRVLRLVYHSSEAGLWQLEQGPLVALEVCEGCREGCPGLWEMAEAGEFSEELDFFELSLKRSHYFAEKAWQDLKPLGADLLRQALRRQEATYGLVNLLVESSHAQASMDSSRALLLAQSALEMAERLPVIDPELDTESQPEPVDAMDGAMRAEMLALAHGVLGNALRVRYKVWDAEKEFRKALEYLEETEDDACCRLQGRARVLSMFGSLLTDTRRLDGALEVLEDAAASTERYGALAVTIALQRSLALGLSNRDRESLKVLLLLRKGYLSDFSARIRYCLWHRLVEQLVYCGRAKLARQFLPRVKDLASNLSVLDRLRVRWVEARILATEGCLPEASEIFLELQSLCLDEGAIHEAALLALEIAATLHALERPAETEEHAVRAVNLFVGLGLDRETLCALSLLAHAAQHRMLTNDLLGALIRYARGGPPPARELWM